MNADPWIRALPVPTKIPDPSPEQISQACLELQATWSAQERRHRAGRFAEEEVVVIPGAIDLGHTFEFTDSADVG